MSISNILKDLRNEHSLSRASLAKILNVSAATISHWENARYQPDIETLIELAEYFDVSLDYLLGRTSDIIFKDEYQKKPLTANETQALKYFHILPERLQSRALGYLQALADEISKEGIKNA